MGGSFFFARRGRGIRGDTEIRRGTLERVPRTPQNFSERIIIAVTRRSCPAPAFFLRSCMAAEIRRGTLERVPRTPRIFLNELLLPQPGARARFQPSLALLRGGWDAGCCRIGLAASAGFEEPKLTFPRRWGKPPYRTLPPHPPPVPRRHSRRGAGGEAPGKTNLWSPPSRWEGGRGG